MARSLKLMLVVLPAMGLSFYGTHILMQQLPQTPTLPITNNSVADVKENPLLTGEGLVYKNTAKADSFKPVILSKEADVFFKMAGRSDRADTLKSIALVAKTVKHPPKNLDETTLPDNTIQNAGLKPSEQNLEIKPVMAAAVSAVVPKIDGVAKPVEIATEQTTASAPYLVDVAQQDKSNSILFQASTQKSWVDGLVTSAFKAKKSKEEAKNGVVGQEASLQRAVAITPRILPSGRTFGGFTENEFQKRELRCMATGLYFEARSEPVRGQLAVGQVIMNRVRSPDYPDTICGVIFQGDHRNTGCQFSFACDGKTDRPRNAALWRRSQKLATDLTKGKVWLKDIANSTHYHADYVHPKWRRSMRRLKKIGRHIFYKSPNISTTATFQAVRS